MKCSLGVSFLKRSLVFLMLLFSSISLHWSLRKAFLSLIAILWNFASKGVYFSFSPLPFTSFLFSAICKASSDNHFAFLHLFFLGMVLIIASCTMSRTSVHSSSGTLSIRSNPLNLFVTSLYNCKGQNDLCSFPGQTTKYHSNPNQECCAPTRNAEEAEVEQGLIWWPTRPSGTNTLKICPFHYWGLEGKSRNSTDTWSNVQVWPWVAKQSRSKANKRKCWS